MELICLTIPVPFGRMTEGCEPRATQSATSQMLVNLVCGLFGLYVPSHIGKWGAIVGLFIQTFHPLSKWCCLLNLVLSELKLLNLIFQLICCLAKWHLYRLAHVWILPFLKEEKKASPYKWKSPFVAYWQPFWFPFTCEQTFKRMKALSFRRTRKLKLRTRCNG